jgi:hypothetical protein
MTSSAVENPAFAGMTTMFYFGGLSDAIEAI